MFTADGRPSDDDPREHGPRLGDERVTLTEALRCARLTLELKCADLDAEAMARRAEVDFATRFVAEAPSLARHMGHADLLRERIDGRLGQ